MKRIIETDLAPKAIGAYSQAIEKNGILFISGQIAINPETGKLIQGGIKEQTDQVLKNVEAILEKAGYTFADVIKSTCLLNNIKDFAEMNEIYSNYYQIYHPARAAFGGVDLPLGALVEIETIAVK
ncbi:MAG: RidA family protein [Bacteroidota bacterium]